MNEQNLNSAKHEEPNYLKIFWWLLALTIIEVIIAIVPNGPMYSSVFQGFLLVSFALTKAVLVALYFMHLKYEKRVLSMVALTPLLLCVFGMIFFMNDIRAPEPVKASSEDISQMIEEE